MNIEVDSDDFEVMETHSGKTDHREWARHASTWLYPGDAICIVSGEAAKILIEVRDELIRKLHKNKEL